MCVGRDVLLHAGGPRWLGVGRCVGIKWEEFLVVEVVRVMGVWLCRGG
jgi:hypothetical protein